MQLSLYCFRPSHALASIGRYDFRMVQDAFQKPEAEILQRSTKMTNRGIIYTLYNGLKKIRADIVLIAHIVPRSFGAQKNTSIRTDLCRVPPPPPPHSGKISSRIACYTTV